MGCVLPSGCWTPKSGITPTMTVVSRRTPLLFSSHHHHGGGPSPQTRRIGYEDRHPPPRDRPGKYGRPRSHLQGSRSSSPQDVVGHTTLPQFYHRVCGPNRRTELHPPAQHRSLATRKSTFLVQSASRLLICHEKSNRRWSDHSLPGSWVGSSCTPRGYANSKYASGPSQKNLLDSCFPRRMEHSLSCRFTFTS